jgi:HK97 gp10 family phage protein
MRPVVKLDTVILDRIINEQQREAGKIVRRASYAVEGQAKSKAPVDTGALKSSLMAEQKSGILSWWVHDGMDYGIHQEFGTSRMAAQPFMIPAVEAIRDNWVNLWREFFKRWA